MERPFRVSLPSRGRASAVVPPSWAHTGRDQGAESHQVVRRRGKGEHPAHKCHTPMAELAEQAHRFAPPEAFFHKFPALLAFGIPSMPRGACVHVAAASRGVSGHMRGEAECAAALHKATGIVEFIRPKGAAALALGLSAQHGERALHLGGAAGVSHYGVHNEPVPVLDQYARRVTQLRLLANALAQQASIGIGSALVRGVAPLLTPKVPLGTFGPPPGPRARAVHPPNRPSAGSSSGWSTLPAACHPP